MSNAIKKEVLLGIDNFKKTATLEKTEAVVARLINLLMMEPGTCRDMYGMGINIKKYQFERNIDNIAGDIARDIQDQVNKYITDFNNITVNVEVVKEKDSSGRSILISFNVHKVIDEDGSNTINVEMSLGKNIEKMSDLDIYVTRT